MTTRAQTGRKRDVVGPVPSPGHSAGHSATKAQSSNGFRVVALKELADSIQYGHTASAVNSTAGPRFLRITDIQNGTVHWDDVPSCKIPKEDLPKYRLAPGDLVFARTGATTGKSFLIRECPEAVFASYLIRVRVSRELEPRYLAAFFQSPDYWRQIEAGKRGIGQPNVNGQTLGEIRIPVRPLSEQRRIVAEIEKQFTRLDAGIAALRNVQAKLKRYRAAVLKAACEGRLVPTEAELARKAKRSFESAEHTLARCLGKRKANWQGRRKYVEPTPPDMPTGWEPPPGWACATIEQISSWLPGSIQSGPFGSQLLHSEFTTKGVLAIGIDNVQDGYFAPGADHRITNEKYTKLQKFTARPKDVVVTVMATVGRVCVLPDPLETAIITKHCYRITPIQECIDSDYLSYALRADSITRWHIFGNIRGQTRAGINGSIVKAAPVALPPLAEQKRIVAEVERRLSVVEELEAVVSANLQRAARLRQSILQKAFAGELVK